MKDLNNNNNTSFYVTNKIVIVLLFLHSQQGPLCSLFIKCDN